MAGGIEQSDNVYRLSDEERASVGAGMDAARRGDLLLTKKSKSSISYTVAFPRHCEKRSDEAIHSFFPWQDGLLRGARNDGEGA
jgi:hypothetical protein